MKYLNAVMLMVLALVASVAAAAVAVANPADLLDGHTLSVCVEWIKGVTLHSDDGAMVALVGAVASLKKKRSKLLEEMRGMLAEAGDDDLGEEEEQQYADMERRAKNLKTRIEMEERLAVEEAHVEQSGDEIRTVQLGNPEDQEKPKPEVRVGRDRGHEVQVAAHTLRMVRAQLNSDHAEVRSHMDELAKIGAYGEELRTVGAGDAYNTLVNADGAILLPLQIRDEIESIADEYGVARQIAQTFTGIRGTLRVPNAVGNLRAVAVNEGAAFTAKKRAFNAINLRPKKWGLIVPWTYEIEADGLAPRVLADANRAIAEGFAEAEDDTMFNGDGSGSYHDIEGILEISNTASYTLPAGKEAFSDLAPDDVFLARNSIPASLRARAAYVFSPDMEPILRTLKDGDGRYLYEFEGDGRRRSLGGRPVYFTQALPGLDTVAQEDTVFGVFGAFDMWKIGFGEGMTTETLREGTIPDADNGTDISLAAQDFRALKVRQFMDMGTGFPSAFALITTAGGAS